MLFYCRFTWTPGTSREDVGRRLLSQDALDANHPERIKAWYTLAGGGAGFLLVEAETPGEVSEIIEPYMDLMAWDVHAVATNDYAATMAAMRREFGADA
jgi:hypothetical protein